MQKDNTPKKLDAPGAKGSNRKAKLRTLNDGLPDIKDTPIGRVDAYLKMRYKEMYLDIIRDEVHFDDTDKNHEDIYIDLKFKGVKIGIKDLEIYLRSDRIKKKNPFELYFEKVKHQDTRDYIEEMANHIRTKDQENWNIMFKKHLVRCVKQALGGSDHWSNRTVLVLRSEKENLGKSTFIRKLNPFGNNYLIETFDDDTALALTKTFFFNIEEIENMMSHQFNKLKTLISATAMNNRRLFTQAFHSRPRRASVWASTNKEDFLGTGENSRWNIHQVTGVIFGYESIDLNKLWGQAANLLETGFDYEMSEEEFATSKETTKEFKFKNNEAEWVEQRFKKSDKHFGAATDVVHYLKVNFGQNLNAQRIGTALTSFGYRKTAMAGRKGYYIEDLNGAPINDPYVAKSFPNTEENSKDDVPF